MNREKLKVGTSVKLFRKTEKEGAHFSQKKAMHKGKKLIKSMGT